MLTFLQQIVTLMPSSADLDSTKMSLFFRDSELEVQANKVGKPRRWRRGTAPHFCPFFAEVGEQKAPILNEIEVGR
ncbi:MAG: hypothetical protein DMG93_21890 [Acidobacteria bacterium]|nr:MAG: hypothetical protein DMG93_21890 [Acidobacteriota bacterium]